MPTVVITGANRGIGLSFATLYKKQGWTVHALCRQTSGQLNALDVQITQDIDVGLKACMPAIQSALKDSAVDLLINNAGILRNEVLGKLNFASIQSQLEINALGPLRVTESLLTNMNDGGKIALITSRMGSTADNTSGGHYGYRMSKAALNIAGVSMAHDLAPRKIAVGIFHPGLVATEMIGGHGDITPDQAASRLAQRIDTLNMQNSGTFWHSNGEILTW